MTELTTRPGEVPQSAAAPSPFPPIADYAFLSNCHTGALVAPDGAIDWLCTPSFDSPSIFGSLLDREAGFFRLGPFGINHPTARRYEPGTNVLITTWKTPAGWIEVCGALTARTARSRGRRSWRHRPTGRTRRRESRRRCASGAAGWGAPGSRTTAGVTRSSARRSRSRA